MTTLPTATAGATGPASRRRTAAAGARRPPSVDAVVDVVRRAREAGTTVEDDRHRPQLHRDRRSRAHAAAARADSSGILEVDREAMTVTARAGTPLKELNLALERLGPLAAQHGRHRRADPRRRDLHRHPRHRRHRRRDWPPSWPASSWSPAPARCVRASADGEPRRLRGGPRRPRRARHPDQPDLPRRAALRHRGPRAADDVGRARSASYDEMVAAAHHVDMYWFPHTDRMMVKQNVRTDLEPGEQQPPSRLAAWWEDELVSNTVFGGLCRIGVARARPRPADQPGRPAARCPSAATATSPTASSSPRAGSASARWSTPSRARSASTCCASAAG